MSTENGNEIQYENANVNDTQYKEIDDDVIRQFKIIMIIVLVVLIAFLGFFVYNLIKCYLPKWRGRLQQDERQKGHYEHTQIKGSQIEFEDVSSKSYN